jgi:hypothetical protein
VTALRPWLAVRTERERRLLAFAAALTLVLLAGAGTVAVRNDLRLLHARVEARTIELAQVRRLAAAPGPAHIRPESGSLLSRLQAATDAAGVAERIAAMTPAETGAASAPRLAVRMTGASLAETVQLLHTLDQDAAAIGVPRLTLRKRPDDPRRFDVTLEVTAGRAP